jgi:hypothetical protein
MVRLSAKFPVSTPLLFWLHGVTPVIEVNLNSKLDAEKPPAYAANLQQFSRCPPALAQTVPKKSAIANF